MILFSVLLFFTLWSVYVATTNHQLILPDRSVFANINNEEQGGGQEVAVSSSSFRLVFIGDVAMGQWGGKSKGFIRTLHKDPVDSAVKEVFSASNYTFANLETPIFRFDDIGRVSGAADAASGGSDPNDEDKLPPPSVRKTDGSDQRAWFAVTRTDLKYLRSIQIDGLTLANNHWYDIGTHGLGTASMIRESGGTPLGVPIDNGGAFEKTVVTISPDVLVAVFTTNAALDVPHPCTNLQPMTQETTLSPPCLAEINQGRGTARNWTIDQSKVETLVEAVRAAKSTNLYKLIIFNVHWGTQFQDKVHKWQRTMAAQLVEAGCHLIVGHHPHRVHGVEVHHDKKNGLAVYSLGSTLWPYGTSPSVILTVDVTEQPHTLSTTNRSLEVEACLMPAMMKQGKLCLTPHREQALRHVTQLSNTVDTSLTNGCIKLGV